MDMTNFEKEKQIFVHNFFILKKRHFTVEYSFMYTHENGHKESVKCVVHHDILVNDEGKPFMTLATFLKVKDRKVIEF